MVSVQCEMPIPLWWKAFLMISLVQSHREACPGLWCGATEVHNNDGHGLICVKKEKIVSAQCGMVIVMIPQSGKNRDMHGGMLVQTLML